MTAVYIILGILLFFFLLSLLRIGGHKRHGDRGAGADTDASQTG